MIIDFQEPYSQGLAGEVEKALKAAGVTTSHQSIDNKVTDFSNYVTKVPSDADIVFFPSQKPGDAQAFAQQLVEQGKKAKVFGGDGTNGPGAFKAAGSYVSNFAPQIDTHRVRQGDHRRLEEGQPGQGPRLLRPADLRRGAGHAAGDQGRLRQGQGQDRQARRGDPERQEGHDHERAGSSAASSRGRRSTPTTRTPRSSTSCRSSPTAPTSSSTRRMRAATGRPRAARLSTAGPPSSIR